MVLIFLNCWKWYLLLVEKYVNRSCIVFWTCSDEKNVPLKLTIYFSYFFSPRANWTIDLSDIHISIFFIKIYTKNDTFMFAFQVTNLLGQFLGSSWSPVWYFSYHIFGDENAIYQHYHLSWLACNFYFELARGKQHWTVQHEMDFDDIGK